VTLKDARRVLSARLRAGGVVGIIGDRDLTGTGQAVEMFGHATTIPTGPAFLAVTHGAALIVGRCLRIGPDRFRGEGQVVEVPATGDRRADIATATARVASRFEVDIGDAPDQWWGAFQPFWPDIGGS
jgi:KDO2-lipid IV(A) lauroyltransferase